MTNLLLFLIGFAAGGIDSIVGGGGLVATPAMMNLFPQWHILSIIGTNRTSSIIGTSVAAWNYLRQVTIPTQTIVYACCGALIFSFFGVQLARQLPPDVLRIIVLTIVVLLAIYSMFKTELGLEEHLRFTAAHEKWAALAVGAVCGFYNGFIGPGTGTLLVFAAVSVLGFNFLRASALAKAANVSGDISSWIVLFFGGYVKLWAAVPLVFGNILGSYLGSQLAISKGSRFIRWVFLAVVLALIVRYALT